jgi:hypothetical protein
MVQHFASDRPAGSTPTALGLWAKTGPRLEAALTLYDKKNSPLLPDDAWLGNSKARCQQALDQILASVIRVLEACGADECRTKIQALQQEISHSNERIREYRVQSLSAPSEGAMTLPVSLWARSRESLESAIADELRCTEEARRQIRELNGQFRNQLQQIGLFVSLDEADSLLLPIQADLVSMAAVITNVVSLTEQLERLLEANSEVPAHARRYYGIFLLLVYAIDRVQMHFVQEIDDTYLPRLDRFEQDARENVATAKQQISLGGPKDQLAANVEAGKTTIRACHLLGDALRGQRSAVAEENRFTKRMLAAAVNTYMTVRVSLDVADLTRNCRTVFRAVEGLQIPRLRPFQSQELKRELHRICECIVERGA